MTLTPGARAGFLPFTAISGLDSWNRVGIVGCNPIHNMKNQRCRAAIKRSLVDILYIEFKMMNKAAPVDPTTTTWISRNRSSIVRVSAPHHGMQQHQCKGRCRQKQERKVGRDSIWRNGTDRAVRWIHNIDGMLDTGLQNNLTGWQNIAEHHVASCSS